MNKEFHLNSYRCEDQKVWEVTAKGQTKGNQAGSAPCLMLYSRDVRSRYASVATEIYENTDINMK